MLNNEYITDKIKTYLIDEKIEYFLENIKNIENIEKKRIEIGKVLFSNGIKKNEYIITPYNINIYKDKKFICEMSFCYGDKINSINYSSKYKVNKPVLIMDGFIFFVWGEFIDENINITNIDLLQWPTNIYLNELKKSVKWDSFLIKYKDIDFSNEKFEKYNGETYKEDINIIKNDVKLSNLGRIMINNNIVEPKEYKKLLYIFENIPVHRLVCETFLPKPIGGFSSQIHHIDNNGFNNNINNLLNITYEQHASIHLYMWNYYKFENGILKNR